MRGKALDLVGQNFGRLTVIKFSHSDRHGRLFLCKCNCGKETKVYRTNLTSKKVKSCGCLNKELLKQRSIRAPGEATFNSIENSYKHWARYRNLDWKLNKEQFRNLIIQNCYYCNIEPKRQNVYLDSSLKKAKGREAANKDTIENAWVNANGIDRIDSTKCYEIDNCLPCCEMCNRMKLTSTQQEFINQCKKIAEKFK